MNDISNVIKSDKFLRLFLRFLYLFVMNEQFNNYLFFISKQYLLVINVNFNFTHFGESIM